VGYYNPVTLLRIYTWAITILQHYCVYTRGLLQSRNIIVYIQIGYNNPVVFLAYLQIIVVFAYIHVGYYNPVTLLRIYTWAITILQHYCVYTRGLLQSYNIITYIQISSNNTIVVLL
jgi:hypothetical protein